MLFIIPIYVDAESIWIYEEQLGNPYLGVCSYKYDNGLMDESKETARINIYYDLEKNEWAVAWAQDNGTWNVLKTGSFSKVFSKSGTNVFIDPTITGDLSKGFKCPEKAWIVTSGASVRPCFSRDGSNYCDYLPNATSTRQFNFSVDLDTFIMEWISKQEYSCGLLRAPNLIINITEDLIDSIKKQKVYNRELPGVMIDIVKQKKYLTLMENKMKEIKNQCDQEVLNDSNLSNDEKSNMLIANQEGLNLAQDALSRYEKETQQHPAEEEKKVETEETSKIENFCKEPKILKAFRFIGYLLLIVKIVIPILLIVLGSTDFVKAVISSDADAVKKSTQTLITRVIAGVVIFFLPTIVNFVFNLIPSQSVSSTEQCRTCIFYPNRCK